MREAVVKEHLQSRPFRPFHLHVSDGASYDVRDPDSVFVMGGRIILGTEPDEAGIPQKAIYIDPIHVTRITQSNGD